MPMRHRRLALALTLLTATVAFGALACGGGSSATATPATTVAGPTGTQGPITLQIISPAEGTNLTNPITLNVRATGIQIAAASERVPGAAHFHAFLDQDPVPEGKVIPSGAGIFHFTDPVAIRPPLGQHKLIVVLGDNDHVRLKGAPVAQVTFSNGITPAPTPARQTP